MERGTLIIPLMLSMIALTIVAAYTPYTPAWYHWLNYTGGDNTYPLNALHSVTFDIRSAYFIGTFKVTTSSGTFINSSLHVLSYNGDILKSYSYYVNKGNLTVIKSIQALGNLYITGYAVISGGTYGLIFSVNSSNGAINAYYFDTATGFSVLRGVCIDALNNVYAVGYRYSSSGSPKINMTVFQFDSSLNLEISQVFYVNGFNLTGWDCTVGPDGYLYVTGTVYWYSGGVNYPVYELVLKLDESLNIVNYKFIPLYNSQYYVTTAANKWSAIATDNNLIYITYTSADEKPSPTDPSNRATVLGLNTSLGVVWNYTLSTDYYEFFSSVTAGSDGSLLVGGATSNNFNTGADTSYYHGLVLEFDSRHRLSKAVYFYGSNGGEIVYDTGIDSRGGTYLAAGTTSSGVTFYDVTKEVVTSGQQPITPTGYKLPSFAIKVPIKVLDRKIKVNALRITGSETSNAGDMLDLEKGSLNRESYGVSAATTSGGLAVKLSEVLSPPPEPVPESLLAPMIVAFILAFLAYLVMRR